MRRAAATVAVLVLAGCAGDGSGSPSDEEVIRAWVEAVSEGDFAAAADRFAEGAIVEQGEEIRLPDRAAAIAFNRGLPCRAELTETENQGEGTVGTFDLSEGRSGQCAEGGVALVLFVIRDGLIHEWRQLPERTPGELPPDAESA